MCNSDILGLSNDVSFVSEFLYEGDVEWCFLIFMGYPVIKRLDIAHEFLSFPIFDKGLGSFYVRQSFQLNRLFLE